VETARKAQSEQDRPTAKPDAFEPGVKGVCASVRLAGPGPAGGTEWAVRERAAPAPSPPL